MVTGKHCPISTLILLHPTQGRIWQTKHIQCCWGVISTPILIQCICGYLCGYASDWLPWRSGPSRICILPFLLMTTVVVVACAVSEHRSRGPVESCGVVCCTPQALSLFLESCDSVLCLPMCLCPFLFVYCPPVYIYCSGLGTFPPVSFPPLQVSSFALLPLIPVSFPPLQSPWCSVTQGPFESCF